MGLVFGQSQQDSGQPKASVFDDLGNMTQISTIFLYNCLLQL